MKQFEIDFRRKKYVFTEIMPNRTIEQLNASNDRLTESSMSWWQLTNWCSRKIEMCIRHLLIKFLFESSVGRLDASVCRRNDRWIWTNCCYGLIFIVFVCDTWCSAKPIIDVMNCKEAFERCKRTFCISATMEAKPMQPYGCRIGFGSLSQSWRNREAPFDLLICSIEWSASK